MISTNKQFIGFSNDRNYDPLYLKTNDEFQLSRLSDLHHR